MTKEEHDFTTKAKTEVKSNINIVAEGMAVCKDSEILIQSVECQCGSEDIVISTTAEEMTETINLTIDRNTLLEAIQKIQRQEMNPGRW